MDPNYYNQGYGQPGAYPSYPQQGGYPPAGYPPQQPAAGYPGYPPQYPPQAYPPQAYPPQGYPQQMPGAPAPGYGAPGYGGYPGADPYAYNPAMYAPFVPAPCTGRKKAVFVGINYLQSARPLKGCVNDVRNLKAFLIRQFGFIDSPMSIMALTDDSHDRALQPTKKNIIGAIKWLVEGAQPGDSLFFHFSGHGGQVRDTSGDESDGFDETILPVDYASAGQIVDDDLNKMLVAPLTAGVRMTILFDSCHSGTAVDLPFTYDASGSCTDHPGAHGGGKKDKKDKKDKKGKAGKAPKAGKAGKAGKDKKAKKSKKAKSNAIAAYSNSHGADVVMFSGCRDDQTSADTYVQGVGATGAMSYAFVTCLGRQPKMSYQELLGNMRGTLRGGPHPYSQVPQLSSNHPMDMRQQFIM